MKTIVLTLILFPTLSWGKISFSGSLNNKCLGQLQVVHKDFLKEQVPPRLVSCINKAFMRDNLSKTFSLEKNYFSEKTFQELSPVRKSVENCLGDSMRIHRLDFIQYARSEMSKCPVNSRTAKNFKKALSLGLHFYFLRQRQLVEDENPELYDDEDQAIINRLKPHKVHYLNEWNESVFFTTR